MYGPQPPTRCLHIIRSPDTTHSCTSWRAYCELGTTWAGHVGFTRRVASRIRGCGITFCVTPLNSDTTLEAGITHYSYFIDEERSIYRGSKVTCQQTRPILNLPLDQCSLPGGNTQEKNESRNSRSMAIIPMIFGQQNYVTWISGYVSLLQHPHTRLYFFFNMTRRALQNIHPSLLTQIPLIALWYPQCWWPVSGIPYSSIISKIESEC